MTEAENSFRLLRACQWLHDLSVSGTVRESLWVFPTLEWIHIYSMIFLVSLIAGLDLRMMGFRLGRGPRQPLSSFAKRVLRWACLPLALNATTGAFLFAAKAPDYYANAAFVIKMLLIALAVVYHYIALPRLAKREDKALTIPLGSKLGSGFSLLLWVSVIAASRWIAFV